METWQEEMARLADEALWSATLAGAYGWCVDEGDEYSPAVVAYSRLDALTVARSGEWGEYAQAEANSKDIKRQKAVADYGVRSARAAGLKLVPDVSERQLGKVEFDARRDIAVEWMMQEGTFPTKRKAQLEWNMREAERETGIARDDGNPMRRKRFNRTYRNLCNRDRKG